MKMPIKAPLHGLNPPSNSFIYSHHDPCNPLCPLLGSESFIISPSFNSNLALCFSYSTSNHLQIPALCSSIFFNFHYNHLILISVLVDPSMAASFTSPPMNKRATTFAWRRRSVKAQIFEEIAETVVSAASRACAFLGLIKKDDASAPATPPKTTTTFGGQG